MQEKNKFADRYSSKIKRIYIPLPEFNFFHSASSEEDVDSKFIGRERIITQLESWLKSENTQRGVYLVTGFRGMGKSSFVGKVLHNISQRPSNNVKKSLFKLFIYLTLSFFIVSYAGVIPLIEPLVLPKEEAPVLLYYLVLVIITALISISIKLRGNGIKANNQQDSEKQKIIPIQLNLGHETLNERDILSLIAKNIERKYSEYRSDINVNWDNTFRKITIILFLTTLVTLFLLFFVFPSISNQYREWKPYELFSLLNDSLYDIRTFNTHNHYLSLFVVTFFSFFISLPIIFGLWKLVLKLYNLYEETPSTIQKKLHYLNERISSSLNEDVGPQGGFGNTIIGISFNQKKRRVYPIADIREIEQELTILLDKISKTEIKNSNKPQFIIVFDELDKIDPLANHEIDKDSDAIPEYENVGSGFPGGATSRKRKQNLLKMLANMKFFISTAKVKFIFIAGRELYDAFLADVSDREFAIGSIFNNVIYVDSFLNSKQNHKDISFMTEQFICKQLIPKVDKHEKERINKTVNITNNNSDEDYTFKRYHHYLLQQYEIQGNAEKKEEIMKVIVLLNHFSVYLSHVSNGAPKKIAIHFEKYVQPLENDSDEENIIIPSLNNKKSDYYLSFSYRDQRKIGFIYYMAFPLINAIFNGATQYGDKLLVSASFLTNHIYKYHNNGFSWRNLENIPELLETNKTPELRKFIHSIISYLKQYHLSSVMSGLYNFKFPMRISEEISLMSKLSEEVSALFNFTLDDSLSVKRHYSKLLRYYSSEDKSVKENFLQLTKDRHHVIAGIHHILGDLHLLDEEYNEAIFEYQCCVQALTQEDIKNNDPHYPSHIINLTRIMLKLGLAHEKRRTYNTAYIVYNELISKLIRFRYIDEADLGLKYAQELDVEYDWRGRTHVLYKKEYLNDQYVSDFEKHIQPRISGETQINYRIESDELIPQLGQQLTPAKNDLIVRLSMFEDIRLIYQPLLAKLFVLEKKGLNGITKENLDLMESEFNYLYGCVFFKDKFMIAAEFFRKAADILYYKNGLISRQSTTFFMGMYFWGYNIENDVQDYCSINGFEKYNSLKKIYNATCEYKEEKKPEYSVTVILKNENDIEIISDFLKSDFFSLKKTLKIEDENISPENLKNGNLFNIKINNPEEKDSIDIYKKIDKCNNRRILLLEGKKNGKKISEIVNKRMPCYACKYYNRSLKILLKNFTLYNKDDHSKTKAILFLNRLSYKSELNSLKENDLLIMASSLDGLGNVLFSCAHIGDDISDDFLECFIDFVKSDHKDIKIWDTIKELSHLEKSIMYFWAAATFFKYASSLKEATLCYKKITQLLVAYVEANKDCIKNDKCIDCENSNSKENCPNCKEAKERITERITVLSDRLTELKNIAPRLAIQSVYSHYENTNMVEIQKLKWLFSKEMYEEIPLNLLSAFPDIEELVLSFYELELLCGEIKENIPNIYNSSPLSTYRIESTVCERIIALRFKTVVNIEILDQLLHYKDNIYKKDFVKTFFTNYKDYVADLKPDLKPNSLKEQLGDYANCFENLSTGGNVSGIEEKIDMIEFLIEDTMFALSKIIETISSSTKTTLYSDSFMGGIYNLLFECNQIYELVYMMYKWMESDDELKKVIQERIGKYAQSREKPRNEDYNKFLLSEKLKEIEDIIKGTLNNKVDREKNKKTYSTLFFETIFKKIDKSNIHNNISNYLAEMALKKYQKAREMHREGAAYKEMISALHFLDDDLNNDTCQFYFAIERFLNNCGFIDRKITKLKRISEESALGDLHKYSNRSN